MAIQQTKKQSAAMLKAGEPRSQRERDLEKRLRLLRQQVYGKNPENLRKTQMKTENQKTSKSDNQKSETPIHRYSGIPSNSELFRSDTTYLNQDLFKILLFSSVAIGAQVLIFVLSKNHILNLKFF